LVETKKQKVAVLLKNKRSQINDFLLQNLNQLSDADLNDLILLLESGDLKQVKDIFKKRKAKITENFLKVQQLAKNMQKMCAVLKRKNIYE